MRAATTRPQSKNRLWSKTRRETAQEEERIKAKKLAKAARKKSKREAKAKTESAKAQADAIEAEEVRRNLGAKKECEAISKS